MPTLADIAEKNRDAVIAGYIEALLWSTGGEPDYSEAPDGYRVRLLPDRSRGWAWELDDLTEGHGDFKSEKDAIRAAWEHSGEEPPMLDGLEWFQASEELIKASRDDVDDFLSNNMDDVLEYVERREYDPSEGTPWHYLGHDFALTRNRHGAGFWDLGLGELGDRLTEAANVYGSVDVYLGDDDQVYV